MKSYQSTFVILLVSMLSFAASAGIVTTTTDTRVRLVDIGPDIEVIESDSGATSASTTLTNGSGSAFSSLDITGLSAQSADLDFNLGWENTNSNQITADLNGTFASIEYVAGSDTLLSFAWDFTYSGSLPFGLQEISLFNGPNAFAMLGNIGEAGNQVGSDSILLSGGETHQIFVRFFSNINLLADPADARLMGSIDFDFAPNDVNAPSVAFLVSITLFALVFRRNRFKR